MLRVLDLVALKFFLDGGLDLRVEASHEAEAGEK